MGLGILEPHGGVLPANVPGTVTLFRNEQHGGQEGPKVTIVLAPNPSPSAQDPLVGNAFLCRLAN